MSTVMRGPLFFVALVGMTGAATAAPMTVTGAVTDAQSHWIDDGSRIVTEATIHTDAGDDIVVSQLGGTVDGLTMRTMPGPDILGLGMRVTVRAHRDVDLEQQMHVVIDDVKVIADPSGFVRTGPTKSGKYLYWESGCIFVTVDAAGTKELAGDEEFPVVDTAIATWNTGTASCSYMKVVQDPKRAIEVGKDNLNVIKFRDVSWCRPASGKDPPRCYADSAAGITTATYVDDASSPRDGAIVDADIELNGVNFKISNNGQSLGLANCAADLQNTLTHELGHLHGLEHTCLAGGDPQRKDNTGAAVPLCSATTDPKITEATMYNYQDCGETKKQTLEPDDVSAVCTVYPKAMDPNSCVPVPSTAGCCDAGGQPAGAIVLSVATGLMCVRRRRGKKLDA